MEKKLKQVSEGQGFICATLEDKKRIWKRLTDEGYEMSDRSKDFNEWENIHFSGFDNKWHMNKNTDIITDPLNESDFFDEWTPQAGQWVEVSTKEDPDNYSKRQYLCTIDGVHLCVEGGASYTQTGYFFEWQHIRQIKPETMTLQEVREALGKPNLIITQ
jgi:hypothetical protein